MWVGHVNLPAEIFISNSSWTEQKVLIRLSLSLLSQNQIRRKMGDAVEGEGRSETEFTEIETTADSLDSAVVFHVVTDILGFVLFMHQQIPSWVLPTIFSKLLLWFSFEKIEYLPQCLCVCWGFEAFNFLNRTSMNRCSLFEIMDFVIIFGKSY